MEIVGYRNNIGRRLDGRSMVDFLKETKVRSNRTFFHHCGSELMTVREVLENGKTYKMTLKEPQTNKDGACPSYICKCHGPTVVRHAKPLLYDIEMFPNETNPIKPESLEYQTVVGNLLIKVQEFQEEMERTKLPSQLSTYESVMPRPWLQPLLNKG